MAKILVASSTRVIVSERISFVEARRNLRSFRERLIRLIMKFTYPTADGIIVVAEGIVDELQSELGIDRSKIVAVRNPVVDEELLNAALAKPDLQAFEEGRRIIVSAGRLSPQKDFETLIKAFALVRIRQDAALVIMGEGPDRIKLEELIARMGLSRHVLLPGYVLNPFPAMRAADLFVLSSKFEGMPGVIIQAMACGTPIVSTDCRTGPREILEDGLWGRLAPVGDPIGLANEIIGALESEDHPDVRVRAADFAVHKAVQKYLEVGGLVEPNMSSPEIRRASSNSFA
jgi:glycosyltransferase involved in cell wall biosynthesis